MSEKVYVTAEECEARRTCILNKNDELKDQECKLWGAVRESQADIRNLVKQQGWFMGIISSVLGGLLVWLITKG